MHWAGVSRSSSADAPKAHDESKDGEGESKSKDGEGEHKSQINVGKSVKEADKVQPTGSDGGEPMGLDKVSFHNCAIFHNCGRLGLWARVRKGSGFC